MNENESDIEQMEDTEELEKPDWDSSFVRFVNTLFLEAVSEWGGGISSSLKPPETSPPCRVLEIPDQVLVIIKGDGFSAEDLKRHGEVWFEFLKKGETAPREKIILLLYIFEKKPCIEALDSISKIKKYINFTQRGIVGGYVLLDEKRLKIAPDLIPQPGAKFVNRTLKKFISEEAPDEEQLLEAIVDIHEKHLEFRELLSRTTPWGTRILVGLCVLMFIWVSFRGGSDQISVLLRFGANYGPLVQQGEWWRLVGSMFLHANFIHLFMNMYVLFIVGQLLEPYFGNLRYMALYAIAGVAGSLASAYGGVHISVGASGAIFGLCGASAWIGYRYKNEIPPRLRNQLAGGMGACILYNLIFGFSVPGIDNSAHIGGLVAGTLFAMLIPPMVTQKDHIAYSPAGTLFFTLIVSLLFLSQGFVLYRVFAHTSFSTREYRGKDCSFSYPDFFTVSEQDGTVVFTFSLKD